MKLGDLYDEILGLVKLSSRLFVKIILCSVSTFELLSMNDLTLLRFDYFYNFYSHVTHREFDS